ncbi:ABC transporter substrate-binding protein [Litchfieldella xinjiangensis]|uniref:ABC transporter substrate-binding protein n=1 Tax=Litchfieldella xinjiangensis TaxID=1166948 RepID=UPI0005BAA0D1|nr:ABC transporter substrate-binding protein [Halomonas xinjiangensis]
MKKTTLVAATLLSLSTGLAATGLSANDSHRIASFDLGSLDTLTALGLSDRVVALPKQSLPDYLSHYTQETYADVGGLRSPDMPALREAEPSLIVITGRQNEWREEFEAIAPVMDAGVNGDDYMASFNANVQQLAERLEATSDAEMALAELDRHIEEARERLAEAPRVLVATHNKGNLMLNRHPVVHEVLGLAQLDIPESVPSETRGERTFTPLSGEAIADIAPDVLLIVDRSAAIGDEPANRDALEQTLADGGAEDVRVEMLSPKLWYLSGGGLQSLERQIDDVVAAVTE